MSPTLVATLMVTIAITPTPVGASQCVLPPADGSDVIPSPATLVGTIQSTQAGHLWVLPRSDEKAQRVDLVKSTDIFTVYGSGFEDRLRSGLKVRIWFVDCVIPKHGVPVAAVVEVCPIATDPCPTE
ncbi:hypothetical protein [Lysobacter sp. GCM10012299]|uniref:hypothetical protein n=1 Tax=Lysobacter sp. GCM10012299 TaxID=3317333 RepID=UPI0036203055